MRNSFEYWRNYLKERKKMRYMSLLSKSNSFIHMDENSFDLSNKWQSNNSVLCPKDMNESNFSFEK